MSTRSTCPFCQKVFDQIKIVLHIALQCNGLPNSEQHENGHKCKECFEIFGTKTSMIQHFRTEHGDKLFTCINCDKTFMNRKRRNMHVQHEHALGLLVHNNNNNN